MAYFAGKDSNKNYEILLKYYLACIEEEDLRSKQVNSDAFNKQYIAPKSDQGRLFKEATEIKWNYTNNELKFLQRYSTEKEQPSYLYGYPIYRDKFGFLLPLFLSEVDVELDFDNSQVAIRRLHPGNLQVNHHLFRNTHPSLVERIDLQDYLESNEFGSFDDRLSAALIERQEKKLKFRELITGRGKIGWKNGSILFRDTGGTFTAQLRRELSVMPKLYQSAKKTSLRSFLNFDSKNKDTAENIHLLEIVELNRSQRDAAKSALNQPFSVITGPPGTGKSQVVVALIASMTAAGRPVLFVSKNNEAVEVVRRKLNKILGAFDWTLRLGSKKNIDQEMQRLIDKALAYKSPILKIDEEGWVALSKNINKRKQLHEYNSRAKQILSDYIKSLKRQRKSISNLSKEWQKWLDANPNLIWPKEDSQQNIKKYIDDIEALKNKRWPGLWLFLCKIIYGHRLKRKFQEKIITDIGIPPVTIPEWLHVDELNWKNLLLDLRTVDNLFDIYKYSSDLRSLITDIQSIPQSDKLKEKSEILSKRIVSISKDLCKYNISTRVESKIKILPLILKEYWGVTKKAASFYRKTASSVQKEFGKSANNLLSIIPAFIVTSLSARRSLPLEANIFDCVIVDEASQCDIASALPLLFRAKRMVVIGDPKQLRHISSINERKEQQIAKVEKAEHFLSRYSYCTKSLFDCSSEVAVEKNITPHFLAEHYRSKPEIIEFSNRVYYNRRLIVRTPMVKEEAQPLLWHDVPSYMKNGKGSLLNRKEADEVLSLSKRLTETILSDNVSTLGIVTPYKRQRNHIEEILRKSGILKIVGDRLRIGTIHTFQGGETDIMIFSPVLTEGANLRSAEWISKEEGLLNVALTRAKKALHIVGDKAYCNKIPGPIGELSQFIDNIGESKVSQKISTPPIQMVCDMLDKLNLWYQREWPEGDKTKSYYLDFMVVGLSGTRYDIEIDGRQHYFSYEAIVEDDARDTFLKNIGYKILRIRAKDLMRSPDSVKQIIGRLV